MNAIQPASLRRLLFLAGLVPVAGFAQSADLEKLPSYVVSATRTPTAVTNVGRAIDTVSAAELARMQLPLMKSALSSVPGAPAFSSGQAGSVTSLFMRGTNSNQTLFLVDGIRFNDPNTDYAVALGGACIGACDSLEVAHGPQSTLYGGEAVGGVVSLRGQRGQGASVQTVAVEAGSFNTIQGAVSAQAGDAKGAYSFSAAGGHTDNDRPSNAFDSITYNFRLDRQLTQATSIGVTWRGFVATYEDPGDKYTNDPDNEERESNQLATIFADFVHSPTLASHVVLGGQYRRFVSENPGSFGTQITTVENGRGVLDWQTTWTANAQHKVTGGFTGEINHTRNTGFGDINERQQLLAFFVQDEWTPVQNLFLTAGLRSDDFDTFGRETTGRVTAAWLTAQNRLKLRASYGTGFRAPSFLDLYGQSAFYVGNPHLQSESAEGWDAGVDYYLADNLGTLSATWFRTNLDDLITFDFSSFPGTVINVEKARTQGVELAAKFRVPGAFDVRFAYTYLDADNLSQGTRLVRRPRHSGTIDLWHDFGRGFSAGTGVAVVADRMDVDAATFATIHAEDYTVIRLYGAWQATRQLALKARFENLFNEQYEEVNGYPAAGFGAYGSVEWKF
jgi:vitamin B12 transporter